MDIVASAAQVQAVGDLGDLSLVVITAGQCEICRGLPAELGAKVDQAWQAMQNAIAALSTNSTHIAADDSYHCVQCSQPVLVLKAIRQLVEQVRGQ